MRLRPRMLVIASAFGLATAGLGAVFPAQALAGTGVSQYCEDDGNDIPILTSPITLGVESGSLVNHSLPTSVMLCYSTSPWGSTAGETAGGAILVGVALPGTTPIGTNCASDANAGQLVTASCTTAVNPSAAFTPAAGGGGTLTVAVPITYNIGSSLTGQLACCTSTPTLSSTGVVIGTLAVTGPPPGYTTGGGVTLTSLNVVIDGLSVPLLGGTTQLGVNVPSFSEQISGSQAFCFNQVCTPAFPNQVSLATQSYSAAEIVIAGMTIAVPTVPGACLTLTCS